jgi:hypothetical protein
MALSRCKTVWHPTNFHTRPAAINGLIYFHIYSIKKVTGVSKFIDACHRYFKYLNLPLHCNSFLVAPIL